jgi:hypothetical protein
METAAVCAFLFIMDGTVLAPDTVSEKEAFEFDPLKKGRFNMFDSIIHSFKPSINETRKERPRRIGRFSDVVIRRNYPIAGGFQFESGVFHRARAIFYRAQKDMSADS